MFNLQVLVGVDVSVRFSGPLVSLWTTIGVSFVIGKTVTLQPLIIGLNVVAATMIVLLYHGRDTGDSTSLS